MGLKDKLKKVAAGKAKAKVVQGVKPKVAPVPKRVVAAPGLKSVPKSKDFEVEPPPPALAYPAHVMAAINAGLEYYTSLRKRDVPEGLPGYEDTAVFGATEEDFQALAHEKKLIDEIEYHLGKRKEELKESLMVGMLMSDMKEVGVSGLKAEVVDSHTATLDRIALVQKVGVAVVDSCTKRKDYSYVKLTDPGRERDRSPKTERAS